MVQANLTIVSVKRNINNDNFVVKAAYGTHSPTSNTSIKIIVWCMYSYSVNIVANSEIFSFFSLLAKSPCTMVGVR